jgi:D-alanine-D-alanine ligase
MPETRPIVLFGGDGNEHRVSVASARNVAGILTEATLWYWTRAGVIQSVRHGDLARLSRPFEHDFHPDVLEEWRDLEAALEGNNLSSTVLFLALHGGSGENGTVQESLEARGVAFTGSGAEASRLCFDKSRARQVVAGRGIRVAEAMLFETASDQALSSFLRRTGKLVFKPVADGSSYGLWFVADERQLGDAVRAIRGSATPYLVESFVEGREITVGVCERKGELVALPCSEVRLAPGRTFDFEGKYLGKGSEEITPAELTPATAQAAQRVAKEAHEATGCRGYSRTDVILSNDGPFFLEINTLPGLTRASFIPQQLEAAGIPMRSFIEEQLSIARTRARMRTAFKS